MKVHLIEFLTKKDQPYKQRRRGHPVHDTIEAAEKSIAFWKAIGQNARILTFEEVV